MFEGKHQPFFSFLPLLILFSLVKTQHRNGEQRSCMERGAGKQSYKEIIDPSFTVYIFWIGKSVVYYSWSGKMGDMKRESKMKKRGGLGRQGLSKQKRKVDIAKNNISILLHCEHSADFQAVWNPKAQTESAVQYLKR